MPIASVKSNAKKKKIEKNRGLITNAIAQQSNCEKRLSIVHACRAPSDAQLLYNVILSTNSAIPISDATMVSHTLYIVPKPKNAALRAIASMSCFRVKGQGPHKIPPVYSKIRQYCPLFKQGNSSCTLSLYTSIFPSQFELSPLKNVHSVDRRQ